MTDPVWSSSTSHISSSKGSMRVPPSTLQRHSTVICLQSRAINEIVMCTLHAATPQYAIQTMVADQKGREGPSQASSAVMALVSSKPVDHFRRRHCKLEALSSHVFCSNARIVMLCSIRLCAPACNISPKMGCSGSSGPGMHRS